MTATLAHLPVLTPEPATPPPARTFGCAALLLDVGYLPEDVPVLCQGIRPEVAEGLRQAMAGLLAPS